MPSLTDPISPEPSQAGVINEMYQADQSMARDPSRLMSVSANPAADGATLAKALKYTDQYGGAVEGARHQTENAQNGDTAESSETPAPPKPHGLWGEFTNTLHRAWSGTVNTAGNELGINEVRQTVEGQAPTALSGPSPLQNIKNFGEGAVQGANDITNQLNAIVKRAGKSAFELADPTTTHMDDLNQTVANILYTPGRLIDPWSQQNGFQLLRHTMAYEESIAQRHGGDYAFGQAIPSLLAMYATDGMMGGSEITAEADAESTVAQASAKLENGVDLSPQEMEAYTQARKVLDEAPQNSMNAQLRTQEVEANAAKRQATMQTQRPVRAAVAKGVETVAAPARGLSKVLHLAFKSMNDVRLNSGYLVAQQQALNGPDRDLWEKTTNGQVVLADGKPEDLAQQTLSYFGFHPGDMFYTPVSGIFNIYTTFLGSDPLGAAGKVVGAAKSFDGISGSLGTWFRGYGIRTADDVYRLGDRPEIFRANDFMASHSAAAIAEQFPGTFSKPVLNMLGDARTVPEVEDVLANMADARGYVAMRAPTIGVYTAFKNTLKGMDETVQGVMTKPFSMIDRAAEVAMKHQLGLDPKDPSLTNIVEKDPSARYRTAWRIRMRNLFEQRPMYFSTLTHQLETKIVTPGDINSIPTIMKVARATGMTRLQAEAMGDMLLHSENPDEFTTAYQNGVYNMLVRRLGAAMPKPEFDSLYQRTSQYLWDEVQRITGVDGAGARGQYVAGPDGQKFAEVLFKSKAESVLARRAASGPGQFAVLHLPEARDINALTRVMRDLLTATVPEVHDPADFTSLSRGDVQELANARGLTLEDAADAGKEIARVRGNLDPQDSYLGLRDARQQYIRARSDIMRLVAAQADPDSAVAFAKAYDVVRTQWSTALDTLNADQLAREQNLARVADRFAPPASSNAVLSKEARDALKGQFYALHDKMTSLNIKLLDQETIGDKEMNEWARGRAKELHPDTRDQERAFKPFKEQITKIRENNPTFRNPFQKTVDMFNRFLSRTFVPLALLSGRWAIHVSMSEAMLNSMREGGISTFDAKVAMAIARHELVGPPLHRGEAALVRDVVGGTLLGINRALLKGMDDARAARLVDDFTGLIMRHDGHLPLSIDHQKDLIANEEGTLQEPVSSLTNTGKAGANEPQQYSEHKAVLSNKRPDWGFMGPEDPMYAKGLRDKVRNIAGDELKRPIAEQLRELMNRTDTHDADIGGIDHDASQRVYEQQNNFFAHESRGLTSADRNAVARYTGSYYRPVNVGLRHGFDNVSSDTDAYEKTGNDLQGLIERSPAIKESMLTYRGLNPTSGTLRDAEDYSEWVNAKPGTLITQKSFVSTSFDRRTAESFAGGGAGVTRSAILEVVSPAGTKGFAATVQDLGQHGENEFILGRGEKFQVVSNEVDAQGRRVIRVEVVDKGKPPVLRQKSGSEEWLKEIKERLYPHAEQAVHDLSPDVRSRMDRLQGITNSDKSVVGVQDQYNPQFTQEDSDSDAARAAVEDVVHSVTGYAHEYHVNRNLLDLAISGNVPSDPEMADLVHAMRTEPGKGYLSKTTAPNFIPTPQYDALNSRAGLRLRDLIIRVSDIGHDRVLGPIVNRLSRDWTFGWDYHLEMEKLRPIVDQGGISEMQAQVMAEDRATAKGVRFVHNPKDKIVYEQNARVLAPFYFAKNQAYRRAFRLLGDDPGAFEKYMKECIAVTNYIAKVTNSDGESSYSIPGTQVVGDIGRMTNLGFTDIPGTLPLLFGLAGSAGSVTSTVPTGDKAGWKNMLGQFASVPFGPLVDIPFKEGLTQIQKFYGPHPMIKKTIDAILGEDANTSLVDDIVANGTVQDLADIIGAATATPSGGVNSTVGTIENEVINNQLDNLTTSIRARVTRQYAGVKMTNFERRVTISAQVDVALGKYFEDSDNYQKFISQAKAATVMMTSVKTILNFFSPLSLSINSMYSKSADMDKLLTEKNPDGSPKYQDYASAANAFALKYPNHILDLTAHTASPYANYPETQSAVKLLTTQPKLVEENPFASAFLVSRSGKFDVSAYQLEVEMGLRSREAPTDYLHSLLTAIGDDWYYNDLTPSLLHFTVSASGQKIFSYPEYVTMTPEKQTDGTTIEVPELSYKGYEAQQSAALQYAHTQNKIWGELGPIGAGGEKDNEDYVAVKALGQMRTLLADPSFTYIPAAQKTIFNNLITAYDSYMKLIAHYKSLGDSSEASAYENEWYTFCQLAATQPHYAQQSYFITSVLQKMATS